MVLKRLEKNIKIVVIRLLFDLKFVLVNERSF